MENWSHDGNQYVGGNEYPQRLDPIESNNRYNGSMKLQLHRPVKPYILYQGFAENNACIEDKALPVSQRNILTKTGLTCPVGYVEFYPAVGMKGHNGLDMFGGHGVPCYYAGPEGIVEEVQSEIERGLGVGIVTKDKFEFEGGTYHAKTRYWHLKGYTVVKGQTVKTGELIGWCDNTGASSGDHLHFELKAVMPDPDEPDYYFNVFQKNGFFGAVDPAPYFNGLYAEDFTKPVVLKTLTENLQMGESKEAVKNLQTILQRHGFFTYPYITDFYGNETRKAVLAFQLKYKVITWGMESFWGFYCGPKTRAALNKLL